eukprot:GHVL01020441.1.p1 GENE.GHVL01020441.1~~GHVL01020441.1.p1  ORF type:complete len:152 (+),score=16.21 GHVL01020441.1:198-653(+)
MDNYLVDLEKQSTAKLVEVTKETCRNLLNTILCLPLVEHDSIPTLTPHPLDFFEKRRDNLTTYIFFHTLKEIFILIKKELEKPRQTSIVEIIPDLLKNNQMQNFINRLATIVPALEQNSKKEKMLKTIYEEYLRPFVLYRTLTSVKYINRT